MEKWENWDPSVEVTSTSEDGPGSSADGGYISDSDSLFGDPIGKLCKSFTADRECAYADHCRYVHAYIPSLGK